MGKQPGETCGSKAVGLFHFPETAAFQGGTRMSLLRKLLGGKEKTTAPPTPSCPHTALVARWDSVEDMGKQDRASSFFCTACETVFSPEEASPYLRPSR